jgi:RNA ligase (TIGR02306 family)
MRQLVTVRTISDIQPIEGADRIEVASIDGWRVVVGKGDFVIGDECVYFEIDSFIPESLFEYLPFLEKNAITWKGKRGTRIRTIKLRKQISQGLAVPLLQFPVQNWTGDLAQYFGVELWEPQINDQSANFGMQKGNFPYFIPKTDQERVQNLWRELSSDAWDYRSDDVYEVTQKLDGTSCTMFFNEGSFGVCSRNFEIKDDVLDITEESTSHEKRKSVMWALAKKYNLEKKLRGAWEFLAFQGEVVGPGINKNRDGATELEFYVFDIYDIENKRYLTSEERIRVCDNYALNHVPIVGYSTFDFKTIDEAMTYAEGYSVISKDNRMREGVVFKNLRNPALSFKIINNNYLLKYGE